MAPFQLEPVKWLTLIGPLYVGLFFFVIDFGILAIMNVIDICFLHGFRRHNGHFAFWMVVLFDTMGLPAIGYYSVRFMQKATLQTDGIDLRIYVVTLIVAVFFTINYAINEHRGVQNGLIPANWTVSARGHNIAGYWHLTVFGLFVWYFLAFLIWGAKYMIMTTNGLVPLKEYFAVVFLILMIPVITKLLDENKRVPSPNELLSRLTKRCINI